MMDAQRGIGWGAKTLGGSSSRTLFLQKARKRERTKKGDGGGLKKTLLSIDKDERLNSVIIMEGVSG